MQIAEIEYTNEHLRSFDTLPKIESFKLDSFNLYRDNEFKLIEKNIANSLHLGKYKTGVAIDISTAKYNEFIKVLDIFLKNGIKQISIDNNMIYYFPCRPPKEFAINEVWINHD